VLLRFEWDLPKAAANRAKHRITFEEASTAFGDPLGRITDDPRHSEGEQRFVLPGKSEVHGLLVVMLAERGETIQLISARRATRRERREYEEGEISATEGTSSWSRRSPSGVRLQPGQAVMSTLPDTQRAASS
jgi:uncharacterized protein